MQWMSRCEQTQSSESCATLAPKTLTTRGFKNQEEASTSAMNKPEKNQRSWHGTMPMAEN